jgi:hypothetical protein
MATLADGGRISEAVVRDEIERPRASWRPSQASALEGMLTPAQVDSLDLFDRLQLEAVISVCRRSASLADAGRKLFAATRTCRTSQNDSARRKYLARFDLEGSAVRPAGLWSPGRLVCPPPLPGAGFSWSSCRAPSSARLPCPSPPGPWLQRQRSHPLKLYCWHRSTWYRAKPPRPWPM